MIQQETYLKVADNTGAKLKPSVSWAALPGSMRTSAM